MKKEKAAADRYFTLGIEQQIIFKVQHLVSSAECIKYMTITIHLPLQTLALVVTYFITQLELLV